MSVHKHLKGFKASFTFVSLGVLLGITSLAAIANAQGAGQGPTSGAPTSSNMRMDMGERVEERRATSTDRREAMLEQAAERRAALPERAQARITNLAANMSNRMDAVIGRLENVIGRLGSRIDKLEAQGVDTDEAETILGNASLELQNAKAILSGIDTNVAAMVGSETPREAWLRLRETFTSARDAIRLTHQGLRNTVAALKAAVAEAALGEGVSDAVDNATTSTEADES